MAADSAASSGDDTVLLREGTGQLPCKWVWTSPQGSAAAATVSISFPLHWVFAVAGAAMARAPSQTTTQLKLSSVAGSSVGANILVALLQ